MSDTNFLRFTGKKIGNTYSGMDDDTFVRVKAGGIVEVSSDMAKRLKSDFPEDFVDVSKADAEKEFDSGIKDALKEQEKLQEEDLKKNPPSDPYRRLSPSERKKRIEKDKEKKQKGKK